MVSVVSKAYVPTERLVQMDDNVFTFKGKKETTSAKDTRKSPEMTARKFHQLSELDAVPLSSILIERGLSEKQLRSMSAILLMVVSSAIQRYPSQPFWANVGSEVFKVIEELGAPKEHIHLVARILSDVSNFSEETTFYPKGFF